MDTSKTLSDFFLAIGADPRISTTHISMFAALLQYTSSRHTGMLNSDELMRLAKISSGKTYYKVLRQLAEFGYIRYVPSFHRNRPSQVHFVDFNITAA